MYVLRRRLLQQWRPLLRMLPPHASQSHCLCAQLEGLELAQTRTMRLRTKHTALHQRASARSTHRLPRGMPPRHPACSTQPLWDYCMPVSFQSSFILQATSSFILHASRRLCLKHFGFWTSPGTTPISFVWRAKSLCPISCLVSISITLISVLSCLIRFARSRPPTGMQLDAKYFERPRVPASTAAHVWFAPTPSTACTLSAPIAGTLSAPTAMALANIHERLSKMGLADGATLTQPNLGPCKPSPATDPLPSSYFPGDKENIPVGHATRKSPVPTHEQNVGHGNVHLA